MSAARLDQRKRVKALNAAIARAEREHMGFVETSLEALLWMMETIGAGDPATTRAQLTERWAEWPGAEGAAYLTIVKSGPYLRPTSWTTSTETLSGMKTLHVVLGVSAARYQELREERQRVLDEGEFF